MTTRIATILPRMHGPELHGDLIAAGTQILPVPVGSGEISQASGIIGFPVTLPPDIGGARIVSGRGLLKTGGAGTKKIHTIVDIKKGSESIFGDRQIPKVFVYEHSEGTYADVTAEAFSPAGTPFDCLAAPGDKLYLGFSYKARCIYIGLEAAAVLDAANYKYSKSTGFGALAVGDGTDDTSPLDQNGYVSWNPPANWVQSTINGVTAYWIELSTVASGFTSGPAIDSIIDKSNLIVIPEGPNDRQTDAGAIAAPVELVDGDVLSVDVLNVPETAPPTNLTLALSLQWLRPRLP